MFDRSRAPFVFSHHQIKKNGNTSKGKINRTGSNSENTKCAAHYYRDSRPIKLCLNWRQETSAWIIETTTAKGQMMPICLKKTLACNLVIVRTCLLPQELWFNVLDPCLGSHRFFVMALNQFTLLNFCACMHFCIVFCFYWLS